MLRETSAPVVRLLALCSSVACASQASAQWTATVISPSSSFDASLTGTSGAQHTGTFTQTYLRASLWIGDTGTTVTLAPTGSRASVATGVSGGTQCGWVELQTPPSTLWIPRAGIWSGTAASWVSLHPDTAGSSHAYGIAGSKQVGDAAIAGAVRASLWTGTAASRVELHPAGATESVARGVSSLHEVGSAVISGVRRAAQWSGTAASYVDLHPAGATTSEATSTFNGVHGGWGTVGGAKHAYIWYSATGARVDLHPAGATSSEVRGVGQGFQVGDVTIGTSPRAALWTGTAASWQDLSLALPANYDQGSATGTWTDATTIYVVGRAREISTGVTRAILWRRPAGFVGCGAPGTASCCTVHATPNCSDATCCQSVCTIDPFCCDSQWDALCVARALQTCTACAGSCGSPLAGDCCVSHKGTSCSDASCCSLVCAADPFCCETLWDQLCADRANLNCALCLCYGDINQDGSVGAADLSIILNAWGTSLPEADLNKDGQVGAADLTELLNAWGPC